MWNRKTFTIGQWLSYVKQTTYEQASLDINLNYISNVLLAIYWEIVHAVT